MDVRPTDPTDGSQTVQTAAPDVPAPFVYDPARYAGIEPYVIKTVQAFLGANPGCDPYPTRAFKDGGALFDALYAADFYAEYPSLAGVPFSVLKNSHSENPTVQLVTREFTEINRVYLEAQAQWEAKWPEHARRVSEFRSGNTVKRKGRVKRAKEVDPEASTVAPTSAEQPAARLCLSSETQTAWLEMIERTHTHGVALLTASKEMMEYLLGTHAQRVRDLDYDRQHLFP